MTSTALCMPAKHSAAWWLKRLACKIWTLQLERKGCQTNDKIGQFYLPTKSQVKNLSCRAKSPDFVGQQNRPILSAKIEHVLSSTILSTDFSYIGQQILFMLPWWLFTTADFSYLLCLLLFSFIRCRKKVMQVLFCDLHSAVVLADNVWSSRQNYRQCVMVHRFCRATQPRPQKSADFVVRVTSALKDHKTPTDGWARPVM